MTWGCS